MNFWMISGEIQVAPSRTSISEASSSLGWALAKASTLTAKAGSFAAASLAICSLLRTLPDRYSSAVFQFWSEGSPKNHAAHVAGNASNSSGVPKSSAI